MRPRPSKPRRGPALVTTLRNVGPSLDSFVAYHLGIGFSRLYLFFDDPGDPDLARVAGNNRVTAIRNDAKLQEVWKTLPSWADQGEFIKTEVMARQVLNAAYAMKLARAAGHNWLLHIDADELFYSPGESAAQHFARLDDFDADTILYDNLEAMTESDEVADPFREVTLFKTPIKTLEDRGQMTHLAALTMDVPQLQERFFTFYINGKSSVRLSSLNMEPAGVHVFGSRTATCYGGRTQHHFILHYACCGFENFWMKYKTLGHFSDVWWNYQEIAKSIGSFHLRSRDLVNMDNRDQAMALYRSRQVMTDPVKINRLLATGLMQRITGPAELLAGRKPAR
ncbi:MAG: hypothetical protein JWM33_2811 [Caulobacteraceae bacterium]|nr:hypothetical protein [Caulobacteraceae bacterium]